MKTKDELRSIVEKIANPNSPVGMDAVYVHALILDKLLKIEERLTKLEDAVSSHRVADESATAPDGDR